MENQRRWVFIVNPVAGNGYAMTLVDKIRQMAALHNLDAKIVITERKGHASELSRQYAVDGYKYIIAVGGDGTYNEVASPLVLNKDVITGEIPGGTANGVNEIAGFPDHFGDEDWDNFFKADAIPMDVGICNQETHFFTGIGIGFDVQVAKSFNESRGGKPGSKKAYIWIVLKMILFYREKWMTVTSDGMKRETGCFMNTVSSGARSYAKAFLLTPESIANDGLFDICSIEKLTIAGRLKLLLTAPKGTHVKDKKVHSYRTSKLSLEFEEQVPYHADGEIFQSQRFEFGMIHNGINLIYNPGGKNFFIREKRAD